MHISIQAYSWDDQDSVVCVASTFNKNYFCSISQSSSILISAPISEVPKKLGGFFHEITSVLNAHKGVVCLL